MVRQIVAVAGGDEERDDGVMGRARAVALAMGLTVGACDKPRAEVTCEHAWHQGITCSITNQTESRRLKVCFDYVVSCRNGKSTVSHICQDTEPGQTSTRMLSLSDFKWPDLCDVPIGFAVSSVMLSRIP